MTDDRRFLSEDSRPVSPSRRSPEARAFVGILFLVTISAAGFAAAFASSMVSGLVTQLAAAIGAAAGASVACILIGALVGSALGVLKVA